MKNGFVWVLAMLVLAPAGVQARGGARAGQSWGNGANFRTVGNRSIRQRRVFLYLPTERQYYRWNGQVWVTNAGPLPQFTLSVGSDQSCGRGNAPYAPYGAYAPYKLYAPYVPNAPAPNAAVPYSSAP